jgi:hypothetical protein
MLQRSSVCQFYFKMDRDRASAPKPLPQTTGTGFLANGCATKPLDSSGYDPGLSPLSTMTSALEEVQRRRTFAIISHPDAGKTTLTEKLLLFSGAIQIAGSVKARKASQPVGHARAQRFFRRHLPRVDGGGFRPDGD